MTQPEEMVQFFYSCTKDILETKFVLIALQCFLCSPCKAYQSNKIPTSNEIILITKVV